MRRDVSACVQAVSAWLWRVGIESRTRQARPPQARCCMYVLLQPGDRGREGKGESVPARSLLAAEACRRAAPAWWQRQRAGPATQRGPRIGHLAAGHLTDCLMQAGYGYAAFDPQSVCVPIMACIKCIHCITLHSNPSNCICRPACMLVQSKCMGTVWGRSRGHYGLRRRRSITSSRMVNTNAACAARVLHIAVHYGSFGCTYGIVLQR